MATADSAGQGLEPIRFLRGVVRITDAQQVLMDCRAMKNLTVISEAGATATVSRVDAIDASAHTTGTQNQFTVAPTTRTVTPVDWPYYLISSNGGVVRISVT